MMEAQRLKRLTPAQVKGIMSANTSDMDNRYTTGTDKGFDFATGSGFIKADAAIAAVRFPNVYIRNLSVKPLCSNNPAYTRQWVITNPNPFEVEVYWLINGFSQQGSVLAAPGETTFTSQTVYFFNRPVSNIAIIDWNDNLGIPHFDIAGGTTARCNKDVISAENTEQITEQVAEAEMMDRSSAVAVYPNPSTKNFRVYLSLASPENTALTLYTLDGKLLLKKIAASRGIVDIDASGYKPGMYILKVKQKNYDKTFQLLKK